MLVRNDRVVKLGVWFFSSIINSSIAQKKIFHYSMIFFTETLVITGILKNMSLLFRTNQLPGWIQRRVGFCGIHCHPFW